jgi:small subunit ribosomal protein S18
MSEQQQQREVREPRSFNKKKRGKRRKVCQFCVDKVKFIDYKDTHRLSRFVSERGKILPRRITGTCAVHQRELTTAIKNARIVALMAYTVDN